LQGLKKVKAHGLGVHTPEEIEQFGKKDLQALSEMLGDKVGFFKSWEYFLTVFFRNFSSEMNLQCWTWWSTATLPR
jgi:hypothetical protein